MKLTILERLVVLPILPEEGNLATMRMRMKLIEKIGLTAEEISAYDVKPGDEGKGLQWRQDLPQEMEIELKPAEIVAIADNLKKLAESEKLRAEHISLYDKFVDDEEN